MSPPLPFWLAAVLFNAVRLQIPRRAMAARPPAVDCEALRAYDSHAADGFDAVFLGAGTAKTTIICVVPDSDD
eukprot:5913542-Pyramimonas_sp.AAC.1